MNDVRSISANKKPLKVRVTLPVKKVGKSDNPKNLRPGAADEVKAFVQLREDHTRRRKAHRKQVRADVCSAYNFGLRLMENDNLWAMFRKAGWKGIGCPQEGDQADAVRFAIKFMVGPGKDAQKKASFYFRAIKKFADEGASVSDVKEALKKYGFRSLTKKDASVTFEEDGKPPSEESDVRKDRRSVARREDEGSKTVAATISMSDGGASTVSSVKSADPHVQRHEEGNRRHPATLTLGWTAFECIVELSAKALNLTRMVGGEELELRCTLIDSSPPTLRVKSVRKAAG